jgi:cytochrome P450
MSDADIAQHRAGITAAVFDHHSAEYVHEYLTVYEQARDHCPVVHSPAHGGYHVVSRYEDIARIARDDDTFSSEWRADGSRGGLSIPALIERHGFIEMDPPASTAFRRAYMPLFTQRAVKEREPAMRRTVEEAIDSFIEDGACDLVRDFTDRIPAMNTIRLLGLPDEIWRPFAEFFHHAVSDAPDDPTGQRENPDRWFWDFLAAEIADRQENPRDDGLTFIVTREFDGKQAPDAVILENVFLIMLGGFDTTSAFLSNTFLHMDRDRSIRQRLLDEPNLMDSACEEFLRVITPVLALARTVTKSCEIGGEEFHEGDRLLLPWVSANYDETVFVEPDTIRLDRFPNKHQSFGLGSHRCLGSYIARTNFRFAVDAVLTRMPDYTIATDSCLRFPRIPANNGWFSMPTTFTPGKRIYQ